MRIICDHCRQPNFSCYCQWLKPIDPNIDFIILIHPIEFRRRIATGRMAHLSLKNSRAIVGHDFSMNGPVWDIIDDPNRHCMILYPGATSIDLTNLSVSERTHLTHPSKKLTVFVIDGTWATARKTVRLSVNLQTLPRICFTPSAPSTFRVRRQPRPEYCSTIEAIYHSIELLGPAVGFTDIRSAHAGLIEVFDKMVERQIELAHTNLHTSRFTG